MPAGKENPATSDETMFSLLQWIKAAGDLNEIRQLSDELERVIFHKQYEAA